MGCDIHLFVEKKINGEWQSINPNFDCDMCSGKGKRTPRNSTEMQECWFCKGSGISRYWYNGRNYDLFAMLADVRNGRGFAGIKTGTGFKPIDFPRGLPEDVSDVIQEESKGWGVDGHSHSYFTVQELLDYPADDMYTTNRGCIGMEAYKKLAEEREHNPGAKPDSWCGWTSGANIKVVAEKDLPDPDATHVDVSWNESYKSCARYFFETFLPVLEKEAEDVGNDSLRIVFWFDN